MHASSTARTQLTHLVASRRPGVEVERTHHGEIAVDRDGLGMQCCVVLEHPHTLLHTIQSMTNGVGLCARAAGWTADEVVVSATRVAVAERLLAEQAKSSQVAGLTHREKFAVDVTVRVHLQEVDEDVILHVEWLAGRQNPHVCAVAAGFDDVATQFGPE